MGKMMEKLEHWGFGTSEVAWIEFKSRMDKDPATAGWSWPWPPLSSAPKRKQCFVAERIKPFCDDCKCDVGHCVTLERVISPRASHRAALHS